MNRITKGPMFDMLQLLKRDIFTNLRVMVPGLIQAVNNDGTVDVQVGFKQSAPQANTPNGLAISYPLLQMCPLVTVQGNGAGVVVPPKKGDGCLVFFSDRCIETWFTTGQPNPLPSFRMHDISDGFALVGVNSTRSPIKTGLLAGEGGLCETNDAEGTGVKIAINPTTHKATISNTSTSGANNLAVILTALMTALSSMTSATVASGATQALITPLIAQLALLLY